MRGDVEVGIHRPFRRTVRQFVDGSYSEGARWQYVLHPKYAEAPEHYVRAFLVIQKDLLNLFDFIEPDEVNLQSYSFRTHEVLLRACVEVEANCKAILKENGYKKGGNWTMQDYVKVEGSHRLSSYTAKVPVWQGAAAIRRPFEAWATRGSLPWYSAYNDTKHDRYSAFRRASFGNVIDAIAGLAILMSAQFWTHDFGPGAWLLALEGGHKDGMEAAIGDNFRVAFPNDWPIQERYDFKWQDLEMESDPFQLYAYSDG
jgi:hypothetical protein